jgi:hypothetical protein
MVDTFLSKVLPGAGLILGICGYLVGLPVLIIVSLSRIL